ncbi:MAG TPA: GNAT family protein, partial [Chloroflexota bacterium]
ERADATLVPMGEPHLQNTLLWLLDPELRRQVDSLDEPTPEGHAQYWRDRWCRTDREDYAILDAAGQHAGNCGLLNIDRRRRKAEAWAYLGMMRGAGLGSSAVEHLLRHAFDELSLHRVYLRVRADNPAAQRFWTRLGFQVECRWRDDTCHDAGFVDSLWLSMLENEYRAR